MKNTKLLVLFLSLFCTQIFSQSEEFSLKDYQYPDLKRQALALGFSFYDGVNLPKNDLVISGTDIQHALRLGGYLNYSGFRNTRNWQMEQYILLDGRLSATNYKESNNPLLKENFSEIGSFITSNNRKYARNNHFLEMNGTSNINISKKIEKYETNEKEASRKELNIGMDLGVGKGRLENVSDAQRAMFLIKELNKYGVVNKSPNKEAMKAVADAVAASYNERFLDNRYKRIFQVELIDSVLQELNILIEPSATAHAIIMDQLFYSFLNVRQSGSRFSFGVTGNLGRTDNFSNLIPNFPTVITDTYGREAGLYAEYSLEIPTSLTFQHSLSLRAEMGRQESEATNDLIPLFIQRNLQGTLDYKLGFYPNTRTNIGIRATLDHIRAQFQSGVLADPIDRNNTLAFVGMESNYWVSRNLRLNLNLGVSNGQFIRFIDQYFPVANNSIAQINKFVSAVNFRLTYFIF